MRWLRNIVDGYILDANYICRYLLADIYEQYLDAKDLIENHRCSIKFEILEEVVYVLEKLYAIPREEIRSSILAIIEKSNIRTTDSKIVKLALSAFSEKPRLDFVDCLLVGYYKSGYRVATFDKKLLKRISA